MTVDEIRRGFPADSQVVGCNMQMGPRIKGRGFPADSQVVG